MRVDGLVRAGLGAIDRHLQADPSVARVTPRPDDPPELRLVCTVCLLGPSRTPSDACRQTQGRAQNTEDRWGRERGDA